MRNLVILAKWLAAQADVDVITWKGSTACIGKSKDGKLVVRMPESWCAIRDEETVALVEGVIDHECLGHGRYTTFEADDVATARGYDMNAFTGSVQNILEDVMIETKAIATYPGVQSNLTRTVQILKEKKDFFGSPALFQTASPMPLLMAGLLNCLRSECVPGQDKILGDNAAFLQTMLDEKFGSVWQSVYAIGLEVKNSNSSIENWELTQRIFDVLKKASESQSQDQSDDAPTDDQSDGDGNGKGQGQNPSNDAPTDDQSDGNGNGKGQGQNPSNDAPTDDQSDGNGNGKGQGQNPSNDAPTDDQSNGNGKPSTGGGAPKPGQTVSVAAAAAASAVMDDLDTEITTDVSTGASQVIAIDAGSCKPSHIRSVNSLPSSALRPEQKRIASQVNAVADDLKEALIAQAYSGKFNKLAGKRLNSRIAARVRTGNPRVFQSKTSCDGVAAAVSILVDTSGSMTLGMSDGVPRFEGSVGVSVGLADVLHEFDVPFELSFYDESYLMQKSFEEDWNSVRKANAFPVPSGGTTTGAALQTALSELILRDEPRKLMIVITDGDTSDFDVLASCYGEAKHAGIEIVSLMIGHPIPIIQRLADSVGYPVATHNTCEGIAKYVVKHVLATI